MFILNFFWLGLKRWVLGPHLEMFRAFSCVLSVITPGGAWKMLRIHFCLAIYKEKCLTHYAVPLYPGLIKGNCFFTLFFQPILIMTAILKAAEYGVSFLIHPDTMPCVNSGH